MSMYDPWSPQPQAAPEQTQPQGSWLEDPKLRGALLQSGLALMQSPSFGDNPASLIGRAVGAGGESVQRQEAADLKQQEADSKAALREMQAKLAGAHANVSESRLGIAQMVEEGRKQRDRNRNITKLTDLFLHDKRAIERGNSDIEKNIMLKPEEKAAQKKPIPSLDEWLAGNGRYAAREYNLLPSDLRVVDALSSGGGGRSQADIATSIANARKAIESGRDREAVRQKLKDEGISPPDDL